ncbi:type II secretion system F family protein [Halosimplex pelagicum]|uniref:Type II secretion system F family protein n=1 Tax=Halosimplex pelagicum TaxID=869886 RepID=A0A7D5PFI0_9EURY|nr:type II secretion system F family protein [Halosimplex pelagicum]QLH82799.1 type II secretion system F family protein [Halosimplex pelagicum]
MSLGRSSKQLGGANTVGDTFYPLYQALFDEEGDFVSGIEAKLAEARMGDNVEMYISRALAVGTVAGLTLWLLGMLLGFLVVQMLGLAEGPLLGLRIPDAIEPVVLALKVPAIVFVSGLVFGAIGFGMGFGSLVSIPYFRSNSRKREINVLLSDSVAFMYALSVGGLNQLEILQAMAQADDTYGEVAKEFQSLVLETEYFDTDYRTAIRNQAIETPSDELSQFLTDMLSIVDSGGDMTSFLEDQKDKQMRTARQEQEKMLDTLELFGEMYMTLSLFPLLLIIITVIMSMMSSGSKMNMMVGTVYGLIPLTGIGFLVLTSTVTQDSIGDGYLQPDRGDETYSEADDGLLNLGLVEGYTGSYGVFDRIKSREGTYRATQILKRPHIFFRDNPLYVLGVTIPITIAFFAVVVIFHMAPMTISELVVPQGGDVPEGLNDPTKRWVYPVITGTFMWVYVPIYLNLLPLAVFYEWNLRTRRSVIGNLSENLRKLASANDTGMTLLESIRVVADTSSGRMADELETMHAKVNYGTSLKDALREFNNRYHIPRLARTVKLISEAQEASSQIQDVLSTAAQASENQDDIDLERKSRARMQMVIIIMTYLTLLGVMALLKVRFLTVMADLATQTTSSGSAGGVPGGSFSGVNTQILSVLFFHAVVLQALLSSFIAGYIRDVSLLSGVKFAVILPTIALIVWYVVTLMS